MVALRALCVGSLALGAAHRTERALREHAAVNLETGDADVLQDSLEGAGDSRPNAEQAKAPAGRKPKPKARPWWEVPDIEKRWPGVKKESLAELSGASSAVDLAAGRAVGMNNGGNTCFMVTMLQMLLHLPDFMRFVTVDDNVPAELRGSFGRLPALLRDIVELYARAKVDAFGSDVVRTIRTRLAQDFGMPQEHMCSTEDAEIVLLKVIEAFGGTTPGLSEQRFETKVEGCDPDVGNKFVRTIPGGEQLGEAEYADWVELDGGSACGKVKTEPRSVAALKPAEAAQGDSPVTVRELLTSGATSDTAAIEGVIDDVYAHPGNWVRCTSQRKLLEGDDVQFNPGNPKNERFCEKGGARVFFPQDMVKVQVARAEGGPKHLAIYKASRSAMQLIERSPVLFLKVARNNPESLARGMGITDPEEIEMLKAQLGPNPELEIGPDGSIEVDTGLAPPFAPTTYHLKACIVHLDRLNHWTSYVRVQDRWIEFNDGDVIEVPERKVLNYARRGSPLLAFELARPPAQLRQKRMPSVASLDSDASRESGATSGSNESEPEPSSSPGRKKHKTAAAAALSVVYAAAANAAKKD